MDSRRMKKAELVKEVDALRAQVEQLKSASRRSPAVKKETEKLEKMKTRFVEAVAHELRTPVTPIKSVLEMLLDGMLGEITIEQKNYLEMMQRNVDRLMHIISEVTSLAKLESGETVLHLQRMSIWSAVSGAVQLIKKKAQKRNIKISLGTQTELFAFADPDAVCMVVTNLVDNAVVHNPEGTKVTISTQLASRDSVRVAVSDNGRGISKEDLENLFTRFSVTRREYGPGYGGAGIGLAVCKNLIEKMSGKITVESQPDSGTTFSFTLPIKQKSPVNSH